MPIGRSIGNRIGQFLLFVLLTIVTIGFYPLYFMVTRTEERNQLLQDILEETRRRQ